MKTSEKTCSHFLKNTFHQFKARIKKYRKNEKWKVAYQKVEKSLIFMFFFCDFDGSKFLLKTWKLMKKHVPTSQKTLFISSMQRIKKCRKNEKRLQTKKIEKSLIFHFFCTLYRTKFFLKTWKLMKKTCSHFSKNTFYQF